MPARKTNSNLVTSSYLLNAAPTDLVEAHANISTALALRHAAQRTAARQPLLTDTSAHRPSGGNTVGIPARSDTTRAVTVARRRTHAGLLPTWKPDRRP
jgi:hypothetical protein